MIFVLTSVIQDIELSLPAPLPDYMSSYSLESNFVPTDNNEKDEKRPRSTSPMPLQLSRNSSNDLNNHLPPPPATTPFPGKIVVRKDSRVPSWFGGVGLGGGRRGSKRTSDDLTSLNPPPPVPPITEEQMSREKERDLEAQNFTQDYDPVEAFDYFLARERQSFATDLGTGQITAEGQAGSFFSEGGDEGGGRRASNVLESTTGTFGLGGSGDGGRSTLRDGDRITFTGRGGGGGGDAGGNFSDYRRDPFEGTQRDKEGKRKASESTLETIRPLRVQSRAPSQHGRNGSISSTTRGVFDSKGLRLSSPNLDTRFNFDSIYRENTFAIEEARRKLQLGGGGEGTTPSKDYTFPPGRQSIPPSLPDFTSDTPKDDSDSAERLDRSFSQRSKTSSYSDLSLSKFPLPPPGGELPPGLDGGSYLEDLGRRIPSVPLPPRAATIVSNQGVEFELFPPARQSLPSDSGDDYLQPGFERDSYDSRFSNNYGVPFMIIGTSPDLATQDRNSGLVATDTPLRPREVSLMVPISESGTDYDSPRSVTRDEGFSLDDYAPYSPAESEVVEIRQATSTFLPPRSLVVKQKVRESVINGLRVEESGRVIPPRVDQDQARRGVGAGDAGRRLSPPRIKFGLPSTPKLKQSNQAILSPSTTSSPPPPSSVVDNFAQSQSESPPQQQSQSQSQSSSVQPNPTRTSSLSRGFSPSSDTGTLATVPSISVPASTYDPRRPFEKPRPVPLVLVSEQQQLAQPPMERSEGVNAKKRVTSRGGTRKEIVVVRAGEGSA